MQVKAVFEIIGDDIEEMSVEMSSDVSQVKNILGQTRTVDNGYSPTMDADPFYADPEKSFISKTQRYCNEEIKGCRL